MTAASAVPSHEALRSFALFELRLTCRTGLHIGSGRNPELVGSDLPVLRDAGGRPLVPGSSLRGVLRSGIEAIVESLDLNGRRPQVPVEKLTKDASQEKKEHQELTGDWNAMPLVERIFGRIQENKNDRGSFASRLQISDLACTTDAATELRDGVAIDRETRTASEGKKFDHEVVPAGTVFEGRVRFRNPEDHELGLVAQALWMLDEGLLLLGGKSSRGLGWVEVQVTPLRKLAAKDLLLGGGLDADSGEDNGFGPVSEHLKDPLDALRRFAESEPKD